MLLAPDGKSQLAITAPKPWSQVVRKAIGTCWPKATIKCQGDPLGKLGKCIAAGTLELKEHYMFRLRVDRRTTAPLSSILECLNTLGKGQQAYVQVQLTPAAPDWRQGAADAYEQYRSGRMPKRRRLDATGLMSYALRGVAGVTFEVLNIVQEVVGAEPTKLELDGVDKARTLREGPMGANTPAKLREDGFDVTIRLAVDAPKTTAASILRSLAYAYREMDGDNALVLRPGEPGKVLEAMRRRKWTPKVNPDYLGLSEVARLLQMPTAPLQDQYHLTSVAYRETDLPKVVTSGGLTLGYHTNHGQKQLTYMPTTNMDEFCLPRVVVGGQGTGKTKGFGANMMVNALKAGFGGVAIDPGRGELGDEIEAVVPAENIRRYRLGKDLVRIDWAEAMHTDRGLSRMASEIVGFIGAAVDDTGAQTSRHLRSASKVAAKDGLRGILRLFTDDGYRREALVTMPELERVTWSAYDQAGEGRRNQISAPVLNRLDPLIFDDYCQHCLDATTSIDLVEDLSEPRLVIIDTPKEELGEELVDLLGAWILSKINIAMGVRHIQARHQGKQVIPCVIVQDEPHQYMKGTRTWKRLAVEGRKYRFAFTWMFHSLEHLGRDVTDAFRSSGCHYHLYTTTKATYTTLAEEIKPFMVEEAMRTPTHHAINVIRADGQTVPPFLAKMMPPPGAQRNVAES